MTSSRITNTALATFLCGIAVGSYGLRFPAPVQWLLAVLLGLCSLLLRKKRLFGVLLLLLAAELGFLYARSWRAIHFVSYPTSLTFQARVVDAPDIRQDKTFLTVAPITPIGRSLRNTAKAGRLLITVNRYPLYHYGEQLLITGTIERPGSFSGFNYPLFLERSGIYGTMKKPRITVVHTESSSSIKGMLVSLRLSVEQEIQRFIPEPESSFLGGILLGSKRAIPTDIQDALKATGTSHIVAISGANITILLSLLLRFLPLYSRKSQFYATVFIGSFMSLLTGASASVVRGAFVAALGQFVRLHGRRAWSTPLLLSSMTIMIFNNPLLLVADPGFQLSFAAFAGLLYLGTPVAQWTEQTAPFKKLPAVVQSAFAETTAATLGTAPFSLFLFGQLSLLGLIVNPLILWLLPPITLLGLMLIMAGWLPLVGIVLSLPLTLMLRTILSTIRWFAGFSFATIHARL